MSDMINIALVVDDRASKAATFVVRSVIASCSCHQRLAFYLVSTDRVVLMKNTIEKWCAAAGCKFEATLIDPNQLTGLRKSGHITLAGFGRVLLPELLPTLSRLIYLDSDVFVNRDISELWEEDISGFSLAAVRDYCLTEVGQAECVAYAKDELKLSAAPAMNSGVLLMDLNAWRKEGLSERLIDFCRRYISRLAQAEQDAFNVILCGQWKMLDRHWNVQLHALLGAHKIKMVDPELAHYIAYADLRLPAIYHFTGAIKPWQGGPFHPSFKHWIAANELVWAHGTLKRLTCALTFYGRAFWRSTISRRHLLTQRF